MTEEATVETTEEDAPVEEVTEEAKAPEEATETDKPEESSDSEDESTAEPKPKKVNKTQKRINELTAARKTAEREAQYWKSQVQEAPPTVAELPKQPTFAEFEFDEARYQQAMGQWTQDVQKVQSEHHAKVEQERQQELATQQRQATYTEKVASFADDHPDFQQVVFNPTLRVSDEMFEAIQYADNGPQIAYHLGNNPDLAAAISGQPSAMQMMEIGRLGAELAKPVVVQKVVSQAPEPVEPVGSTGKVTKDPAKMTDKEFASWRKRQIAQR